MKFDENMKLIPTNKNVDLIDRLLYPTQIYKRYGRKYFDTSYESILSPESINSEKTFISSINRRIGGVMKLVKECDNTMVNIICTHGEILGHVKSYVDERFDDSSASQFSSMKWCAYMQCILYNKKLGIQKIHSVDYLKR
jgi:hypothetical protein